MEAESLGMLILALIVVYQKVNMWNFLNVGHIVCIYTPRKPADLQNLAPGTHPPFITFNNEVKTDVNKIEEFLEEILCPPK